KLDLARCGGSAGDRTSRAGQAWRVRGGRRCENNQVWRVEIGAIEQVEDFSAELQAQPLANFRIFQHREIPSAEPGTDIGVSAKIACKTAGGGRSDECVWIEPLVRVTQNNRAREIRIQKRSDGISRVAGVRRVVAQLRCERETRLNGDDAWKR